MTRATRIFDLQAWWADPGYQEALLSASGGGEFILRRLLVQDPARLRTVLWDLFRKQTNPEDVTMFEWKVILEFMGASPAEVIHIQQSILRGRRMIHRRNRTVSGVGGKGGRGAIRETLLVTADVVSSTKELKSTADAVVGTQGDQAKAKKGFTDATTKFDTLLSRQLAELNSSRPNGTLKIMTGVDWSSLGPAKAGS